MMARLKGQLHRYGKVGIGVYLVLMAVTFAGSFLLIRAGVVHHLPEWILSRLPADATSAIGAYALYKSMQLPRMAIAVAITPLVARLLGQVPSPSSEAA
jgi:hypothetical protein